jgi:hypothetical protein
VQTSNAMPWATPVPPPFLTELIVDPQLSRHLLSFLTELITDPYLLHEAGKLSAAACVEDTDVGGVRGEADG